MKFHKEKVDGMKKLILSVSALLLTILLLSVSVHSFAADGTMKIRCGASKVYCFQSPENKHGNAFDGSVSVQKGRANGTDRVRLSVRPCTENDFKKLSAKLTVRYQDGTSTVITKTVRRTTNGGVRIVVEKNGTQTENYMRCGQAGETLLKSAIHLDAGSSAAALKRITAEITQTGLTGGDLHYTVKT